MDWAGWLTLDAAQRRAILAAADRVTYVEAREWATGLIAAGQISAALPMLDDLLAAGEYSPFAQADVFRALRRLPPPRDGRTLDVDPAQVHAYVDATLRDARAHPGLLRVVPDLLRYAAHVLFVLGDLDGVVAAAHLARTHGARLARGYGASPLERIRDDMTLAPMWNHPGYAEVFDHLAPAVFTDAAAAVDVPEHVRHLRLRRPAGLPDGMAKLVHLETVELEGAGDATTAAWLRHLATSPALHTLELSGAAQRLLADDEDLLAELLVAPGLRRLRIGYPVVNPWSMRALLADLRRSGAPPRTRMIHLALVREEVDYVLAHARTADLVAALDSGVAAVRGAALHLLDGVFGAPAVQFSPGDEVLVVGRLHNAPALTELAGRLGLRIGETRGPRTRLVVIAERHAGAALELLDSGLPLVCEGQVQGVLETASAQAGPASVARALASPDAARVSTELTRLGVSRARRGSFEGLVVVITNPRAGRSQRQAARRILVRDAPADLVDAVEDVAGIVRALDRTGSLSTWELQETGVETDGLVDVVELAVLLLAVRRGRARPWRLDVVRGGLAALPEDVAALDHLRTLRLDDNRFTEVPRQVLALHDLTELSLAGNRLRTLPADLAQLASLTVLDVGHNPLAEFPPVLARLTALRRLDLTVDGQVVPGPDGADACTDVLPPGLRELVLDGHDLPVLPGAVRSMAGLERLSLRRGRLGELPSWLAELPHLATLALDGTVIDEPVPARRVLAELRERGVAVSAWPTEPGP